MNLDQVMRNAVRRKKRKRIGRGPGSGHGKTSGKGQKGQKSRSGYSRRYAFEGGQMPIARRVPKKGFNNKWRVEYEVINLDQIDARFEDGSTVSPATIREAGLLKSTSARIKILGRGELTKKVTVEAHRFSATARSRIEASGGKVVEVGS
jgi:large subunit ribosomal protein L15